MLLRHSQDQLRLRNFAYWIHLYNSTTLFESMEFREMEEKGFNAYNYLIREGLIGVGFCSDEWVHSNKQNR